MTGADLARWYWLKEELVAFARSLQVPTSGSKQELTKRLIARLDGETYHNPPARLASHEQLSSPINENTVVPKGQRCSQLLRRWFVAEVGPNFRFDGAMRDYFANLDGRSTLRDAVEHWYATRIDRKADIGEQFELNRFTRTWHAKNPGGSRRELQEAWAHYRSTPVDVRGKA